VKAWRSSTSVVCGEPTGGGRQWSRLIRGVRDVRQCKSAHGSNAQPRVRQEIPSGEVAAIPRLEACGCIAGDFRGNDGTLLQPLLPGGPRDRRGAFAWAFPACGGKRPEVSSRIESGVLDVLEANPAGSIELNSVGSAPAYSTSKNARTRDATSGSQCE